MISLILLVVALIAAAIHLNVRKKARTKGRVVEVLLHYLIPINLGVMAVITFVAQIFFGRQIAEIMGWQPNPAFQFEVGMVNLGYAIVGFLSIWQKKGFWFSTVLTNAVFLLGCGIAHIYQLMQGVKASLHGLLFLYVNDIIVPIFLLILVFMYAARSKYFMARD